MNIFNKLGEGYESLWKLIIRPQRNTYSMSQLGPEVFFLENRQVKRIDIELTNPRGLTFYASHFIPLDLEKYPCVVYLHGNSSNRTEGIEYLGELIKEGISLLTFDFTGCGNSEGEYISLGWYEWEDLAQVIEYLEKRPAVAGIGLWGRSMGAVTSLMYLKQDDTIKAAVFDSPFMSLKTLIEDLCKKNSKVPMFIFSGLMKIISNTIKDKAKFDLYKLNPVKEAPHIYTPGFFIAAVDDELVGPNHTKQNYKAYAGKKHLEIVPGDHNANRPQKCIDQAVKFLKDHLVTGEQIKKEVKPSKPIPQKTIDIFDEEILPTENEMEDEGEIVDQKDYKEFNFFPDDDIHGKNDISNFSFDVPQEKPASKFSFQNLLGSLNPFTFNEKPAPIQTPPPAPQIRDRYGDLRETIGKTYVKQTSDEAIKKVSKQSSLQEKRNRENKVTDPSSKEQFQANAAAWAFK